MSRAILERAVKTHGVAAQLEMVVEECSELILAIQKYKRDGCGQNVQNIVEEAADVENMVDQIRIIFGDQRVNEAKAFKVARLEGRLNEHDRKNTLAAIEELRKPYTYKPNVNEACYCEEMMETCPYCRAKG